MCVKIYRNLLDWKWKRNPEMFSLWLHLLFTATPTTGQVKTSRKALAEATGLSEKQVRTCLNRLIEDGSLTKDSSRQGTVYTITNWTKYQEE